MRIFIAAITGGLLLAMVCRAEAAFLLTDPSTPVGSNFDSFQGSAATLPANFSVGGTQSALYGGFFTDGSSAYSTSNAMYAGTQTSNTSDNSFDARVPVGTSLTLTFSVTNNTGAALNGLTVNFNEEQYQDAAATPNTLSLLSDNGTGTTTFNQTNLTGNINSNELAATGTTTVYTTPLTAARTATYNQAIANGATVQLQFSFVPGGGGNRPIFGIDDLAVTGVMAVPEPPTGLLFVVGALCLALTARLRRGTQV